VAKTRLPSRPDILTASSHYFNFFEPRKSDFNIRDVAIGLSNECRYAGQLERFYSVAQHSVIVSYLVPKEYAYQGLMHDAAEAFIGDVTRPLKRILHDYLAIEQIVEEAVMERFNVPFPFHSSVKQADFVALVTEARDVCPPTDELQELVAGIEPRREKIWPMPALIARYYFLNRYDNLREDRHITYAETIYRYQRRNIGRHY